MGLLRVSGADLGRKGVLRFSVMGEFFSSADFPVQGAKNTRTVGTFAVGYVPLEFLDVSLAYSASTNTNTRTSPTLIQALGDVTLGVRATKQWLPGLWAGADVRAMTFSGVGDTAVAFGFSPRAVVTYDARAISPMLPESYPLLSPGLDPARLESEGFGDSRPVAPNLTPKGRELNRRVDFVILER